MLFDDKALRSSFHRTFRVFRGIALGVLATALMAAGGLAQDLGPIQNQLQLEGSPPATWSDADRQIVAELLLRMAEVGAPSEDINLVWETSLGLAEAQLPVRPVASRYLQGLAKGVPLVRIHAAAEGVVTRLRDAQKHLSANYTFASISDPQLRNSILDHGAYALEVGVGPEMLNRSLDLCDSPAQNPREVYEDIRSPILAMSFLVYAGVDDDRSFELVSTAWDQGYRGPNLERLGESVVRLGQTNLGAVDAVNHVMVLLEDQISPDLMFESLDTLGDIPFTPGHVPVDDPARRRTVPGDRPDNNGSFGGSDRGSADRSGGRN